MQTNTEMDVYWVLTCTVSAAAKNLFIFTWIFFSCEETSLCRADSLHQRVVNTRTAASVSLFGWAGALCCPVMLYNWETTSLIVTGCIWKTYFCCCSYKTNFLPSCWLTLRDLMKDLHHAHLIKPFFFFIFLFFFRNSVSVQLLVFLLLTQGCLLLLLPEL